MIHFNFQLSNPFSHRHETVNFWTGVLTQNKAWELQTFKTNDIVNFSFSLTTRGDHSGLAIELGVLGRNAIFQIYDGRHWDHEKNTWTDYE
jgi:hypothetical protein